MTGTGKRRAIKLREVNKPDHYLCSISTYIKIVKDIIFILIEVNRVFKNFIVFKNV